MRKAPGSRDKAWDSQVGESVTLGTSELLVRS